jgi:hypothetical protein
MSDPIMRAYADVSADKRKTLGLIFPDLAAALAAANKRIEQAAHPNGRPSHICAHVDHAGTIIAATGRTFPNGEPRCAEHLKHCKRPGGYPLQLVNPRDYQ